MRGAIDQQRYLINLLNGKYKTLREIIEREGLFSAEIDVLFQEIKVINEELREVNQAVLN